MLFSSSLLSTGIITAGEAGLSSYYFEDKVAKAIRQLKSGKTPGICGIPAELLKAGAGEVVDNSDTCGRQASMHHLRQ